MLTSTTTELEPSGKQGKYPFQHEPLPMENPTGTPMATGYPATKPYGDLMASVADCGPDVRSGFIRKVYAILGFQLSFTLLGIAFFMNVESARTWVLATPGPFYAALFLPFILLFALHCKKDSHPTNLILLSLFTLCEAYSLGVICAMYQEHGIGHLVLEAVALTAAVFIGLTAYVFISKKDFSFMGGALFTCLTVLIVWSIFQMFFDFGPMSRTIFSLLGALLFSLYILYDTSLIMNHLSPDDYIMASINLYLDVINLFLMILNLLNGGRED